MSEVFAVPADFPCCARLEANWKAIRAEYLALDDRADWVPQPQGQGWSLFPLYALRNPLPAALVACPLTMRILETINDITVAGFSRLAPHSRVALHRGSALSKYHVHLGLQAPSDCCLRVGNEVRRWREGKCLVFDNVRDHESWNDSPQTRSILLLAIGA